MFARPDMCVIIDPCGTRGPQQQVMNWWEVIDRWPLLCQTQSGGIGCLSKQYDNGLSVSHGSDWMIDKAVVLTVAVHCEMCSHTV